MNQRGFFMYLAGENTLKVGSTGKAFKEELLFDEQRKVYGIKRTESYKEKEYIYYEWKQDSVIWNAESLLKAGDYPAARIAYQKAISQNPEHLYLYQAKEHLEYLQSKPDSLVQQNFQRLVGQYGAIEIWIEEGLLYYKRPGVTRRIFRPISDNRFTTLLHYSWNYEFVEKEGKIVGIQGHQYNHETKEWGEVDDWYYERTELLD